MSLSFYNTLTRQLEEFRPIHEGKVGMYCCGPTVYNYVHIGNLRAYTFNDLLRRYLRFRGYAVTHVMNITDVDDKTIRDSKKEGKSLKDFTTFYTDAFFSDLTTLGIERPDIVPLATDEIDGMVQLVQVLLDKGHAYKTDKGDVYFRIDSCEGYGQLANLQAQELRSNADGRLSKADEYGKDNINDFALWKAWDEDDGDVYWETAVGKGRPGWHLECSAMSTRYLGQPFDIHCGGIDLIFPHHTNEIAQSQCACDTTFANYWMHHNFLVVDGKKMSKSLGNFYRLKDLLEMQLDPMAIRYEYLKTHYRQQLDFQIDSFPQNMAVLDKFSDFNERLAASGTSSGVQDIESVVNDGKAAFITAMDNDLNISGGLAAIFDFMSQVNKRMPELSEADVVLVQNLMDEFH
ncbi:MAG: cysteine--tRNA ligase, partial [Bdellovibrionales bacterium]|nr:cysteine--tRNA ligase [Bdellovibrionales bacterium]